MATKQGEENVATLFADVHYFYSPAEVKPRHHRFDKGSYVYLFENANERRCRVEIANNPGTSDQDAFEGFLDQTYVRYSYRQHGTVSITVADSVAQNQWHLPTYDPRNENKYHYRLHSLDIYFWTQQDALQFLNAIRRVLPPNRLEVLDEPAPPVTQPMGLGMSAVVQRLENAAISDSKYRNDQASMHSASNSLSRNSVGSQADPRAPSGGPGAGSLPPPPPNPPQANQAAPSDYTPMAYNPAAPAAPEAIRHREKTPPPDEDPLNPLAVAVAYDYQRQPFTPGPAPISQFPPMVTGHPPNFAPPPMHAGLLRTATTQAGLQAHGGHAGADIPGVQGIPPPPPLPSQSAPAPAPAPPPPPPQQQHLQQQQQQQQQQSQQQQQHQSPPPGGFSNYSYEQTSPPQQQQNMPVDYSIHNQVYRPTEQEAGHRAPAYQPKGDARGRMEENVGRFERGMSGMLKKFEKKFG